VGALDQEHGKMMTVGLRPAASGPGDPGPAQQPGKSSQSIVLASLQPAAPTGSALPPFAVPPATDPSDTTGPQEKRLSAELTGPPPSQPDGAGDGEAPIIAQPEPAGPLKTFAQIPTEVMQEISRLREEAAAQSAQGVPGRNDPTPMPASPAAIGGSGSPYDAA
jgi:hypothetical protein